MMGRPGSTSSVCSVESGRGSAPPSTSSFARSAGIAFKVMGLSFVSGLGCSFGPAIEPVQHGDQFADARVVEAIPDGLAVAPGGDDAALAHLGEVLRQRRLAE